MAFLDLGQFTSGTYRAKSHNHYDPHLLANCVTVRSRGLWEPFTRALCYGINWKAVLKLLVWLAAIVFGFIFWLTLYEVIGL